MQLQSAGDLIGLEGPRWPHLQNSKLVLVMCCGSSVLLHVASHPLGDRADFP